MISRIPNEDSYINTIRILMQNPLVEDSRDIRIFAVALSAISKGLPLPDDLGTRPVAYTIRGLQDERTDIVSSLMDGEVDRFQELFHLLVGEKACQLDRFLETTVNKDPIDILRASLLALPGSVISNSIKEALFNDWLQSNLTVKNLLGMLENPLITHCSKGMISRFFDAFLKTKPTAEELRIALCRIPIDFFPGGMIDTLFEAFLKEELSAQDLGKVLRTIPIGLFPEGMIDTLFEAFLDARPTVEELRMALCYIPIDRFPERMMDTLFDAFLAGGPTAEELRRVLTHTLPALFPEGMAKELFDALLEVADTEYDLRTALEYIPIDFFPEGMASRLFGAYQEKFPQNAERLKMQLNAKGLDVEIKK